MNRRTLTAIILIILAFVSLYVVASLKTDAQLLAEFYSTYKLEPAREIKAISGASWPPRLAYLRIKRSKSSKIPASYYQVLHFTWDGSLKEVGAITGPQPPELRYILRKLTSLNSQQIEGETELLSRPIQADFIVKEKCSLQEIARCLEDFCDNNIRIDVDESDVDVIIARGNLRTLRRSTVSPRTITVYNGSTDVVAPASSMGSGSLDKFASSLGELLGRPILLDVDEKSKATNLDWAHHISASEARQQAEAVLKHISDQTGLSFEAGKRKLLLLKVTAKAL